MIDHVKNGLHYRQAKNNSRRNHGRNIVVDVDSGIILALFLHTVVGSSSAT